MPVASDFCGQFWAEINASPIDALISASTFVSEHSSNSTVGKIRGFSLFANERISADSSGRPVFGYPKPLEDPAWVASDLIGGRVLTHNLDFTTDDTNIWFYTDPLDWSTTKYFTWEDKIPVETADLIYGVSTLESITKYPEATFLSLTQTIATNCDSPAIKQEETVEDIWQGYDGVWRVITDKNAYRLSELDSPTIEIGDVLPLGSPLGSAWTLTKLGPELPALDYLTIPASYHQGVTIGGITWNNTPTPLIVDVVATRTRVRWVLGGTQSDVDAFWNASHTTGTQGSVKSLAQAMDLRINGSGDPGPESLPTSVNPLEFICRELFAGNAYLLIVYPSKFGPNSLSVANLTKELVKAAGPYISVLTYTDAMPSLPPAVVS